MHHYICNHRNKLGFVVACTTFDRESSRTFLHPTITVFLQMLKLFQTKLLKHTVLDDATTSAKVKVTLAQVDRVWKWSLGRSTYMIQWQKTSKWVKKQIIGVPAECIIRPPLTHQQPVQLRTTSHTSHGPWPWNCESLNEVSKGGRKTLPKIM